MRKLSPVAGKVQSQLCPFVNIPSYRFVFVQRRRRTTTTHNRKLINVPTLIHMATGCAPNSFQSDSRVFRWYNNSVIMCANPNVCLSFARAQARVPSTALVWDRVAASGSGITWVVLGGLVNVAWDVTSNLMLSASKEDVIPVTLPCTRPWPLVSCNWKDVVEHLRR